MKGQLFMWEEEIKQGRGGELREDEGGSERWREFSRKAVVKRANIRGFYGSCLQSGPSPVQQTMSADIRTQTHTQTVRE